MSELIPDLDKVWEDRTAEPLDADAEDGSDVSRLPESERSEAEEA